MTTTSKSEYEAKVLSRGKRWEAKAARQTSTVEKSYCLTQASDCYASLGLYPTHLHPDAIRVAVYGR
jgi:hypothetical protein